MKIRYYGHAGQTTGYGRAAEGLIHALVGAGASVELRTLAVYDTLSFGHDLPLASLLKPDAELDPNPDVVIVHTLPGDCARVVEIAKPSLSSNAVWIAYTTWEALDAPDSIVETFGVFDEVWHPSSQSADTFDVEVDTSMDAITRVMPHSFDETKLPLYRERYAFGPADTDPPLYRFYSIGAWTARKNPLGLIRAFAHAFRKQDRVELLLACQGMTPEHLMHAICATGIPPQNLPPIRSDFRPLSDEELWRLHRGCDCFVSASRGEAWNLPAFEAVLAGRHVIAPRGLGSDAFLSHITSHLYNAYPMPAMVDTRAVRDAKGVQIQTVGAQGLTSRFCWSEPDLLELASAMRTAYDGRLSLHRACRPDWDLAAEFGHRAVGQRAMAVLTQLVARSTK